MLPIPPHLQIAQSVTDEDYESASMQARKLKRITWCGLLIGILPGILVFYLYNHMANEGDSVRYMVKSIFYPFLAVMGTMGSMRKAAESKSCKDAKKLGTLQYQRYPELRDFKKRNQLSKEKF